MSRFDRRLLPMDVDSPSWREFVRAAPKFYASLLEIADEAVKLHFGEIDQTDTALMKAAGETKRLLIQMMSSPIRYVFDDYLMARDLSKTNADITASQSTQLPESTQRLVSEVGKPSVGELRRKKCEVCQTLIIETHAGNLEKQIKFHETASPTHLDAVRRRIEADKKDKLQGEYA